MPLTAIQIEHQAMTTRWRLVLRGWAGEELNAVADFCTTIIDDWDRLLSFYNPASEVSRVNRTQPGTSIKLHPDLIDLLMFCDRARQATHDLFEVAQPIEKVTANPSPSVKAYQFNIEHSTFKWLVPGYQLDFGGIAKGYVLDQLLQFVRQRHVTAALFDAGGSSLLAWDSDPEGAPWLVTLSPPGQGPRELVVGPAIDEQQRDSRPWVELQNMALAYSATRTPGTTSGQTIDPRTNQELPDQRACVVITQFAAWAEILSTTALCMGEDAAAKYIKEGGSVASQLGWLVGETVHWRNSDSPV